MKTYEILVRESLPKNLSPHSYLPRVFNKEIYEPIFVYYFAWRNVKKNSSCSILSRARWVIKGYRDNQIRINRSTENNSSKESEKSIFLPASSSDDLSLGCSLLNAPMFHFDGICGVSPGRRFANAIYRPFIYFRPFLSEARGRGRPIPGCRSLS